MRLAALIVLASCAAEPSSGTVTVSGTAAPNVEVVFRSGAREEVARAGADGTYQLAVAPGTYRVFVRDDAYMSVGEMDREPLQTLPSAAAAGVLDEALVPSITLVRDTPGVDLVAVRGGIVTGTVFDVDARPVMGVVVSAHSANGPRPVLGTDVAISRYDGTFELRVPDGDYRLAAQHAQFADALEIANVDVGGGSRHVSLTLLRGCAISGKVIGADGKPAGEGAIELRIGASDFDFAPAGRIEADGTFRVTTTDEREIVIRAWPWHHPPSPSKRFSCRDGANLTTTFTLPARAPDVTGMLVDKRGAPVPFTHLDIQPLDPGGIAQHERTDATGSWVLYAMPPGRYTVTAKTRGGVVAKAITVPGSGERLGLSGTGRIEGTTTNLVTGSFELAHVACVDGATLDLPRDRRLVPVTGGRFVVDDVPACDLQLAITWRGETSTVHATVPHDGVARVQLDIGPPRAKHVTGVVRDRDGRRVANAQISAIYKAQSASAISDEEGRFEIDTFAGATISATRDGARGETEVGLANLARERVEIVLAREPNR